MKQLIFFLIIAALFASCDRYLDSNDPIRPEPEDAITPTKLSAFVNNETVELSWTMSQTDGVIKYYIYASENSDDNYNLIDSSTTQSIILSDLKINSRYYFKVAAVYSGDVAGIQSEAVSALASYLSIKIANDAEYINTRNTTIQIVAPTTATHIAISEDSTFADVDFDSYSKQKSFNIDSDDDGLKVVYAKIQFNDGSISGTILRDSVTLDTKAQIDSVFYLPDGNLFGPGDTVVLALSTGETDGTATISFNGSGNIDLVDDGTDYDPIAEDGIYYGWYLVPVSFDLFEGTITGNFTDRAGNRATAVTAYSMLNINTPPDEIVLSAYLTQTADSVVVNWTSSTSSDFVKYRLVSDDNSNVNETDQTLYETSSKNTTSVKLSASTGTTYYKIYVYDRFEEFAGSNTVFVTK